MIPDPNPPVVALLLADGVPANALDLAVETLREFGIDTVALSPLESQNLLGNQARLTETQGWRAVIVASEDARLPAAMARVVAQPVIRVPFGSGATPALAWLQNEVGDLPSATDDEPFATVAIGAAGAKNSALFVVSLLALDDDRLRAAWERYRTAQTDTVLQQPAPTLV